MTVELSLVMDCDDRKTDSVTYDFVPKYVVKEQLPRACRIIGSESDTHARKLEYAFCAHLYSAMLSQSTSQSSSI